MRKKLILTALLVGSVASALKLEAVYYQRQIQRVEDEKMNLMFEIKKRFNELDVCESKLQQEEKGGVK
jgi:hypothetical protein